MSSANKNICDTCSCLRECVLTVLTHTHTHTWFFFSSLQSCSECPEPTLAQSLCTLCNKWLCYQCTDVHQHHRAPATAQYADVHPQQRPGATQHPDQHQKGSSALPVTGQGKMFTCLRGRLPLCSHLCGMLILEPGSLSLSPESLF